MGWDSSVFRDKLSWGGERVPGASSELSGSGRWHGEHYGACRLFPRGHSSGVGGRKMLAGLLHGRTLSVGRFPRQTIPRPPAIIFSRAGPGGVRGGLPSERGSRTSAFGKRRRLDGGSSSAVTPFSAAEHSPGGGVAGRSAPRRGQCDWPPPKAEGELPRSEGACRPRRAPKGALRGPGPPPRPSAPHRVCPCLPARAAEFSSAPSTLPLAGSPIHL